MNVQCVAMDVHQLLYGRITLHEWTSISFYMDVLHDIRGRPRVSIWTYNMWPWTSVSYYMDVQHYISGRPSVSLWTYYTTSLDVPQFLYGRTTCGRGRPCYYMDVPHYISGRQSVSLRTYNITSVDVHLFLYERTMCGHGCPPVTIWTYNIT